jgi:hypothetical protein
VAKSGARRHYFIGWATKTAGHSSIRSWEMQDFWSGKYFKFLEKKVTGEQLFDLNVAKEAQARLAKDKPFSI